MSALKSLALSVGPKLLSIGGANLKSSDPYSVDAEYLLSQFSEQLNVSVPAPRMLLDPLGYWKSVS